MKTWACIMVTALLSACTVGPDFKPPAPPSAASYTAGDDALPSEQKVEIGKAIAGQWWTLFKSPPLDDTIHQAIAGNYDIAAARETLAQAEEAVNAESGALLPQASVTGTAGRQKYGVALFGPAHFSIPPFTYYEAGPEVSLDLDLFGAKRRSIERQQALADYQAQALDAAYIELTGDVVAQAVEIAASQAEIAASEHIIAEDKNTVKLAQIMFSAGEGAKTDVLSAQSQLAADQAALPPIRQRLSAARHALSILAGKAPAGWSPPDFRMQQFALPKALPVSLPSQLVRQRPDILAAEANLHAASAAVGIATANLYPDITLSADMLQEALTPRNLFEGVSDAWALAANLTAPIAVGGTLTARKREAEHAYQAALARYRQTILLAFGQVADALTALAHDTESVHAEQQALDAADASLALARRSYRAGAGTLLQIQDEQRRLARAELDLIRAQKQRYLDTAQLFIAAGGAAAKGDRTLMIMTNR